MTSSGKARPENAETERRVKRRPQRLQRNGWPHAHFDLTQAVMLRRCGFLAAIVTRVATRLVRHVGLVGIWRSDFTCSGPPATPTPRTSSACCTQA